MMTSELAHVRELSVSIRTIARWRVEQGLTAHQAEVCLVVLDSGAISAAEISRSIGITTASMSRLLAQLEKAGWIMREPDTRDARRQVVRPAKRLASSVANGIEAVRGTPGDDRRMGVPLAR